MATNTYGPAERPKKQITYKSFGKEGMDESKKLRVYSDGGVEVEDIRERSTDGLSYALTAKEDSYYFSTNLDANTKVKYIPKDVSKVYSTTVNKTFSIKKALAVFSNDVKKFIVQNLDRYRMSNKGLKKEIDKVLKNKNQFLFTDERQGQFWNKIYIDTTTLGPYNCNTNLVVTKDINSINDILVVKTGHFRSYVYEPSTQKYSSVAGKTDIAWVSATEMLNYSGEANYFSSGRVDTMFVVNSGIYSGESFWKSAYGVGNNYDSYALSSRFMRILKGEKIKTDINYEIIPIDATKHLASHEGLPIENQLFYDLYPEYKTNVSTGYWDGVIPSGSSIEIQTWSTNPQYIGFNGEITVKPVDESMVEDIDLSCDITCTAEDLNYQASVRKAIRGAKNKFYKKLNKLLIEKGLKPKKKRYERYEKMLERVAQDVYDGISFIRNESVSKVQGTEANPLEGPVYYDGTSKAYGDSKENSSYDYSKTTNQRTYKGLNPSSTNQSSSSSSQQQDPGGY